MIQPVVNQRGVVVGTIDVESDRVNAFSSRDEELLGVCAKNLILVVACQRLTTGCDEG